MAANLRGVNALQPVSERGGLMAVFDWL